MITTTATPIRRRTQALAPVPDLSLLTPDLVTRALLTALAKLAVRETLAVLRKLPQRLRCPCCRRTRYKDKFGLRVISRDGRGIPRVIIRQSYCLDCRHRRPGTRGEGE